MGDICRRDALRTVFRYALVLAVLRQASVAVALEGPADQPVAFEWRVPADQADIVRKNLVYQGREMLQTDSRGVPVVIVFIGGTLVAYLAKAILAVQLQMAYGGVSTPARSQRRSCTIRTPRWRDPDYRQRRDEDHRAR